MASLASLGQPSSSLAGATQQDTSVLKSDDGNTIVTFTNVRAKPKPTAASGGFYVNLAEKLDQGALNQIAADLIEGIDADIQSRNDWIGNYVKGLDLLGLKIEADRSGGKSKTSTVRHPLLFWAILKAQAQARGEMLPADGPVKVKNAGDASPDADQRADDLERDMNFYLTTTATEYYPDTDRGLFYLFYGGNLFKKPYRCPRRKRPVSECVYAPDLIVSQDATDLENALRVTHRIEMSRATVRQMQEAGVYVDAAIGQPMPAPTPVQAKQAQVTGVAALPTRPADMPATMYETYTTLDLTDYGLGEKGQPEGVPLPYKVTLDKEARQVVELRRNWREKDELFRPRKRFIHYGVFPGMGFLNYGFLHLLGNHSKALTGILRIMVDGGMFANFPGGVRVKGQRLATNEINPAPGEFLEMETGGLPIQQAIMSLPFKGPTAELLALFQALEQEGQQMAGTADIETGDSRTNVPVGTIMAMIEQQTQVMTSVHKRFHQAQQQELGLLKELFAEDPEALWRGRKQPARQWASADELTDLDLVPASDPNVPAAVHRKMQATALYMIAKDNPQAFNQEEVYKRVFRAIGLNDTDAILAPQGAQQGQQGGPGGAGDQALAMVAQAQAQAQLGDVQVKGQKVVSDSLAKAADIRAKTQMRALDSHDAVLDRQSRERIASQNNQTQLILKGLEALGQPLPQANTVPAQAPQEGSQSMADGGAVEQPPVAGARKAPDGNWYVKDPRPHRQGKYMLVNPGRA